MNKTEEIFERLRHQQPQISNPDELTALIMNRLDDDDTQLPAIHPSILRTLRVVSAMAATWLVGLFVFLNNPVENQQNDSAATNHETRFSRCSSLKKMYSDHQQKSQTKQLNYTQLKRMIYENR